jgi:hypothetical protein
MSNEVVRALPTATQQPQQNSAGSIAIGQRGLVLRHLADAWRFANYVAASGLAPKGLEKAESILVAMQYGMELGLTPMQAIQSVAVVNGRPSVYGDTMLALCMNHPDWLHDVFHEWFTGKPYSDDYTAHCRVGRRGRKEPIVRSFSVEQAKRAALWSKSGPWTFYPDRMLQMRARAFALRDAFPDVLRGCLATEELIEGGPTPIPTPAQTVQVSIPEAMSTQATTAAERVAEKIARRRGRRPAAPATEQIAAPEQTTTAPAQPTAPTEHPEQQGLNPAEQTEEEDNDLF